MATQSEITIELDTHAVRLDKLKKDGPLFRDATFDRSAINQDERTVALAFSSETPVARWFGNEILDHNASSVRMQRLQDRAALLLNHDMEQQIGVVQSAAIGPDKVGRAVVKFSRSSLGQEIFQDVVDGIREKVSVGYAVHDMVLESRVDGQLDTYRVTDWEPLEISIVAIPADARVGVGRQADHITQSPNTKGEQVMEPVTTKALS